MSLRRGDFVVRIHKSEYRKICEWTLMKKNIETGGDLFGLWYNSYTPVVQLVLGPGKNVNRTSVSFFQDVDYLESAGYHLTQNEGLCHIGEWHSHHQMGLERPSGGDVSTVWGNMPSYNLQRFFIFIANIEDDGIYGWKAKAGCFLFEYDPVTQQRLPMLQGRIVLVDGDESPFRPVVAEALENGAESIATGEYLEVVPSNNKIIWCTEMKKKNKLNARDEWGIKEGQQRNREPKRLKLVEYNTKESPNDDLRGKDLTRSQTGMKSSLIVQDQEVCNMENESEEKGIDKADKATPICVIPKIDEQENTLTGLKPDIETGKKQDIPPDSDSVDKPEVYPLGASEQQKLPTKSLDPCSEMTRTEWNKWKKEVKNSIGLHFEQDKENTDKDKTKNKIDDTKQLTHLCDDIEPETPPTHSIDDTSGRSSDVNKTTRRIFTCNEYGIKATIIITDHPVEFKF